MPIDNQNLITEDALKQVLRFDGATAAYKKYLQEFENNEELAFSYLSQLIMAEISNLPAHFSGIYEAFPTMPIYLNKMLTMLAMKSLLFGELKWKPELPDTCTIDRTYKVKSNDFE